jgi:mono/diheme cytochrome c family protein
MNMRRRMWFMTGAVILALLVAMPVVFLKTMTQGFSARAQPTALEAFAAGIARDLAIPAGAKEKQNPVAASEKVFAEARAHWADHCASCHGNDGSGQIPMGQQMYPPAPDMRKEGTQKKTDGELFYVIENGIRLSGMPAWGGSSHHQQDSWKLVRFIRRLPSLSQAEIKEMEALNPKTPDDLREEKEEEEFLKGAPAAEDPPAHHHH